MIELLKHTEALLLENDCVIIPGFGGFVSHYTSAKWIEDEGVFLPPTRTIGFNPQLKMNDGLLVQSYMTAYCTDFSDASKLVEKAVNELVYVLNRDGKVEMHGIGDMFFTIHNTLQFKPYEDGLLTPYLYGLSSFEIDKLDDLVKPNNEISETRLPNSEVFEIRVSRSLLRTSVAVAAAIILFFFMSTPIENTYVESNSYAQLIPSELLRTNDSQSDVTPNTKFTQVESTLNNIDSENSDDANTPIDAATAQNKRDQLKPKAIREVVIPKKVAEKKVVTTNSVQQTATKGSYHIIIASVMNRADAQEIVNNLKSKGYSGASYIEGTKRIRVSIMSFANDSEANTKLSQLKKNSNFKDAWVLTNN
ncbi:SPOR domain-containing protein [Bacteroides sedimenti]|uniref:Cell division protein n=1 Tax=Bacteroides sedimenti TaxID=2136147 RepID=A0ABM8I954_9BACE